jgi:hypothetical protein
MKITYILNKKNRFSTRHVNAKSYKMSKYTEYIIKQCQSKWMGSTTTYGSL